MKILMCLAILSSEAVFAKGRCEGLPSYSALQAALTEASADGAGGIFKPNKMWAAIVNRAGDVCAVAKYGDAWPGSRVIAAQKASTANAFSNDGLALSTANLFSAVQPGGSLFGLQFSNPVDPTVAYHGDASKFGSSADPMIGQRIGGINVFGGGLALYAKDGKAVLGGIGVSGDTSCADHNIAWRMRHALALETIPGGISPAGDDNIIYDIAANGKSVKGFGHPECSPESRKIAESFKLNTK